VKRPSNIIYAPDDRPAPTVMVVVALQLFMTVATNLVYPLVILRVAEASTETTISVLSLTLIVCAAGTILQVLRHPMIGSGYLAPMAPTAIYFGPSLVAAKLGGLPLVFAMTIVAGVVEMAVSRILSRLRAILPPEVAGTVVFLVGLSIVVIGVRNLANPTLGKPLEVQHWYVAATTFVTMIALSIWGNQLLRTFAILAGIGIGYFADLAFRSFRLPESVDLAAVPFLGFPGFSHIHYDFNTVVLPAFIVAAVAAALKAVGLITVCQKSTDADWVRPEMGSMSRGVMADGATTSLAGLFGTVGMNIVASSVALSASTGIHSRSIAFVVAGICVLLAIFPSFTLMLTMIPIAVISVTVLVLGSFILVNGLQLIVSRLMDVRRTLVVGLAIAAALLIEVVPTVADMVPSVVRPFVASSLGFGTLIALAFNLLFRLGTKQKVTLTVDPTEYNAIAVEDFLNNQGAQWGARPDIIRRAIFGISQALETVIENCEIIGSVAVDASFDEFNLEIYIRYRGIPLELPERRPSDKDIIETEAGHLRLAGYMLRRNADRIAISRKGDENIVHFHFNH
jgi:xanthine permease XanP